MNLSLVMLLCSSEQENTKLAEEAYQGETLNLNIALTGKPSE